MRKNDLLVHTFTQGCLMMTMIQLFSCFYVADLDEYGDGHNDDGDADDKDDDHAIDLSDDDDDTTETDYSGDDDDCKTKKLMLQPC